MKPKYKVGDRVEFLSEFDYIYVGDIWKIEIKKKLFRKRIIYYINHLEYKHINVRRNFIVPESDIIKKV